MFKVYYRIAKIWCCAGTYALAGNAIEKFDKLKKYYINVKITLPDENGNEHPVVWTNEI